VLAVRRIAVFAKWPEPGHVKTRLSPALPAPHACDLYRAMLEDALAAAQTGADEAFIYWADSGSAGEAPAIPPGIRARPQRGPELGARLEHAFEELLLADHDRALIIGADCPALDPAILEQAYAALERHDLALGPTRDGGYYLVGLRRAAPPLFRDIAWSTERVFGQTVERARAMGLAVKTLPELTDLDTAEDLVGWLKELAGRRELPRLRSIEALRAMKLLPERE
jgi:hypothetical protein